MEIADVAILKREAMYIHCPKCKGAATIPIAYGEPTDATIEAGQHGLIHLAGCVIFDEHINRHCKACGCDFIAYDNDLLRVRQNQVISIEEMNHMLDDLESDLKAVRQDIECEYMRLGREAHEADNFKILGIMRMHHEAWALFLDRLQARGDPTIMIGYDGNIMARYSNNTARIYQIKMNSEVYWLLTDLAKACHWLGRTSRGDKNDIDDLKSASIAVQNARQEIVLNWARIRKAATSYRD